MNERDQLDAIQNLFKSFSNRIGALESRVNGKNKPSKYRVNLVSLGRLGYSFAMKFLNHMRNDDSLLEFNIWHRAKREIVKGKCVDVEGSYDINKSLLEIMIQDHKDIREKVNFRSYRDLSQLKEGIVDVSNYDRTIGDITVLTSRYNFNFEALSLANPEQRALIESVINSSVYNLSGGMDSTIERITEDRKKMVNLIERVKKETGLDPKRADNLINSVIGARELARIFEGYPGNLVNAINEVDTTSYVIAKESGIDPRRVTGLCDNDRLRMQKYLMDVLPAIAREFLVYATVIGTHNEFLTEIEDMIWLYGKDKHYNLCEMVQDSVDFNPIREQVIAFGHKEFDERKSADEDPALALVNMVLSIILEERLGFIHRASTIYPREEFFTGLPIYHDSGLALSYSLSETLAKSKDHEKKRFEDGNQIQKEVNESIKSEEVISKGKCKYEESQDMPFMLPQRPIEISSKENHQEESPAKRLEKDPSQRPVMQTSDAKDNIKAGPVQNKGQENVPSVVNNINASGSTIVVGGSVVQNYYTKPVENPGIVVCPPQPTSQKVIIPSDLEEKLYANQRDQLRPRHIQSIAELTLGSREKRFFEFDFSQLENVGHSKFIKFVADKKNVYALFDKKAEEENVPKEYGLIIWDKESQKVRNFISFGNQNPTSLTAFGNEVYVSFENKEGIENPVSIRRISEEAEVLQEFYGVQKVNDIAVSSKDGIKIYGVSGSNLHRWSDNLIERPEKSIQLTGEALNVDFHNGNRRIVVCTNFLKHKVFIYDLNSGRKQEYDSFKGFYDLVFDGDKPLIATARKSDMRPELRYFNNIDDLLKKTNFDLKIDPAKEYEPNLGMTLLKIRGLALVDDLLLLYGADNNIYAVEWNAPYNIINHELPGDSTIKLDNFYLLRNKDD